MRRMVTVVARRKVSYGTRRLRAGAVFDVWPGHARLLTISGAVAYQTEHAEAGPDVFPVPRAAPRVENYTMTPSVIMPPRIDDLRQAYELAAGVAPDKRWRERRLETELARLNSKA